MINVFHAVLWDRICGIFALVFLAIVLLLPSSFATKFPHLAVYSWVLLAAIYPCAYLLNKLFYKQFIGVFTITAIESMLVQVTQVISVFFIIIMEIIMEFILMFFAFYKAFIFCLCVLRKLKF